MTQKIIWDNIARDKQKLPSGSWFTWLIMAGRGFGKTRTGAENIMKLISSGKYKNIAIIGKTLHETKQIMVEGQSGILSTTYAQLMLHNKNKEENKLKYFSSKRQIEFSNGAKIFIFSGDYPNSLRGFQFDLVWIDEFAKFQRPAELWEQVLFCLRLGDDPRCIITTTPKSLRILKDISEFDFTYVTVGSTFENYHNLSSRFLEIIRNKYDKTYIGQQELFGKLLLEKEHPLWKRQNIIYKKIELDCFEKIVIGVDPAVTTASGSDETGIIVAGLGLDKNFYVLADLSGQYTGTQWARIVVRAMFEYSASYVIVETNNGGDLVEENLRSIDHTIPVRKTHAVRGKIARAEPVAILYESGRVFHFDHFDYLEEQMCDMSYDENDLSYSPDRVDALVWAVAELRNLSAEVRDVRISVV